MTAPLLEVRGIGAGYGQIAALREVDLTVGDGEAVALLGANGAGKSTLIRTVMGLLTPTRGEIRFAGAPITGATPARRAGLGIGYVPEGRRVFPGLTAVENLLVACTAGRAERTRRLDRVLGLFPALAEKARTPAWQLSGGQQQMLAIGRALMTGPRLLLLDEPSLGLSPRLASELLGGLRGGLLAETGAAVLLAEQNATKALAVCDRGYVLRLGRVVAHGPARDLAQSDAVRRAFLGGDADDTLI
ncbi:MAG TPA: ABC transporter ATP-binding protein [Stellaceae bacterium]|jgi:branched-chain amino acid transport system ATP-binding protein